MRVLQVMSSTSVINGIAHAIMNYFRLIDKSKIIFDFLVFSDSPMNFDDEIERLGGRVFHFTKPGIKTYFKAKKELKTFFDQHKNEYDIVHCNEVLVAKQVFYAARKYGNCKTMVSHSHSCRLSDKFTKRIRNRLLVAGLANKSDYCFACSSLSATSTFGKRILDSNKYKLIYNAIDADAYSFNEEVREKTRKELGLGDNFILGNVGRLDPNKNQIFAIKVLQEILRKRSSTKLLLIGEGKDKEFLEKYVKINGLESNVMFLGRRHDVAEILNAMDYFVFPSKHEGLGIALIEAQASGLPCCCYENLPKEVYVTQRIKRFEKDSAAAQWAEAILDSVCNDKDRKEDSEKIKKSNFNIANSVRELENTYFEMRGQR